MFPHALMSSPPPSYFPPRPPPPYKEQNNENEQKEGSSSYKISQSSFAPLSGPAPTQMNPATLHSAQHQSQMQNPPLSRPLQTTHIVVIHSVKEAPTFSPYITFCEKCGQNVTTKQTFVSGTLTWIVCILVLFFFFPLAFVPFCLDSCKDVHHYCPKCAQLLSIKKRFF